MQENALNMKKNSRLRFCFTGLLFLGTLALFPAGVFADVVFLHGEGILQGRVVTESQKSIVLELLSGGRISIDSQYVKTVVHEPESQYLLKRGDFWLRQENFERAEKDYFQALEKDPDNRDVLARLESLNNGRRITESREYARRARLYLEQKSYRNAIRLYQKAVDICPDEEKGLLGQIVREKAKAHARLAFFFYNHCYDDWAMDELEQAKTLDPDLSETYFVYARIYHYQNNLEAAVQSYRRTLDLNPENQLAQNYLLQIQEEAKRRRGVS